MYVCALDGRLVTPGVLYLLCRVEQGAKDVIGDLRAWCRQEGGPLALGVVRNNSRSGHPGSGTM